MGDKHKANCFFEVVPEEYSGEHSNDVPSDELAKFIDMARSDGFSDTVIERAKEMAKEVKSYNDFLGVLSAAVDSLEEDKAREEIKRVNIRKSVKLELEKLREIDVYPMIEKRLLDVYKTSAASPIELVDECNKKFGDKARDLYEECKYAVYMCITSDWVKEALLVCINKWDSCMSVKRYVCSYLKQKGYSEAQYNSGIRALVDLLPDNLKNENSPHMYKAFRAVQIITHKQDTVDESIYKRIAESDAYYDALIDATHKGIPLKAAEQIATGIAAKRLDVAGHVGSLIGTTVALKYKMSNSFDEAIRESLGDDADKYFERREERKERSRQKKIEGNLKKSETRAKDIDSSIQVSSTPTVRTLPQQKKPSVKKKQVEHIDLNPYIPTWVMFAVGGIIVSLVSLLFGKFLFCIVLAGTSAASIGWFFQSKGNSIGGKSPILYIAGGYCTAVLAILVSVL